ncbi:MAG: Gfo/Idh/MocA family protein [Tabrizicola sp.]
MRWGLVGASTIAAQHMIGAIRATGGEVAAVVSTSAERAADFARTHGIPAAGADLGVMLADPGIGAFYISSTNEKHRPQALAAIAAGKHVLCEKPLAMTVEDAVEMVHAARAAGVTFG